MSALARGQVVLLPFPFSDLTASKLRPALVVADADHQAVTLEQNDFAQGGLQRISYARPAKLFTAHESLVTQSAGVLQTAALDRVCDAVVSIVRQGR